MAIRGRYTDVKPRLDRILDTNGDGTGTKNANIDGSVTPVLFSIAPPATGVIVIHRLLVTITDNALVTAEKYGGVAMLTNGISIGLFDPSDDSLQTDYLDGIPIQSNCDWGRVCYDVDLRTWGTGNSFIQVRWTLSKSGTNLILRSSDDYHFGVLISDDITGLIQHYFGVQGWSS